MPISVIYNQVPTNAPTNPQPTTGLVTEHGTCLCCLNSRGFGDYFKFLPYEDEDEFTMTKCTSAVLKGTNTLELRTSICNVEMLLIGGGGGGGGAFPGELLKSSKHIFMRFILVYF